jgi:hypothetical protein
LIGQGPPILQEIVRDIIGAAPDMKLVGKSPARHTEDGPPAREWLRGAVDRIRPDVVVVAQNEGDSGEYWSELLRAFPGTMIIGISPGGRDVFLYEFSTGPAYIGEASEPVLLSAIRAHRA